MCWNFVGIYPVCPHYEFSYNYETFSFTFAGINFNFCFFFFSFFVLSGFTDLCQWEYTSISGFAYVASNPLTFNLQILSAVYKILFLQKKNNCKLWRHWSVFSKAIWSWSTVFAKVFSLSSVAWPGALNSVPQSLLTAP